MILACLHIPDRSILVRGVCSMAVSSLCRAPSGRTLVSSVFLGL